MRMDGSNFRKKPMVTSCFGIYVSWHDPDRLDPKIFNGSDQATETNIS